MFMSYQTSIQSGFYRLMTEWVGDPLRPVPRRNRPNHWPAAGRAAAS